MINKKRVRRIKNLIYAFIILVLFLPLILISILSFRIIGLDKQISKVSDKLGEYEASVLHKSSSPSPSNDDYVIEPEGQSAKNESPKPQQMEETNPKDADDQTPADSGLTPESSGTAPAGTTSNENNVGGDAGLNDGGLPLIGNSPGINTPTGGPPEGLNGNPATGR